MANITSTKSVIRFLAVPVMFSVLVWILPKEESKISIAGGRGASHSASWNSFSLLSKIPFSIDTNSNDETYIPSLVPSSLYDSYRLGYISAQLDIINDSKEIERLLEESMKILDVHDITITVENLTNGVAKAAKMKDEQKGYLARFIGAFSFMNVLSFLSLVGIMVTLLPTLSYIWQRLGLERLLYFAIEAIKKIHRMFPLLFEIMFFALPLKIYHLALNLHGTNGGLASSQIASLSAALSGLIYVFYCCKRFNNDLGGRIETLSFLWLASFLFAMAIRTSSKFLGFFAIGAIYGALGFMALPTPFGWVAGFQDELSADRSTYVSLIIIFSSIITRTQAQLLPILVIPDDVQSVFETGAAVFGMVAFGLAGLIKSSKLSDDGPFYFSDFLHPRAISYPLSWMVLAGIGYVVEYPALSNTSLTFVVLWISQFYWRFVGFSAITVFVASLACFGLTLFLKMHPAIFSRFFHQAHSSITTRST